MAKEEPKVLCRTPTPGKQGTRIDKWKYDAIRKAIRTVVPRNKDGLPFSLLAKKVGMELPMDERKRIGSVSWYTVTVKLDMEVRGELERIAGARPQRIRRTR